MNETTNPIIPEQGFVGTVKRTWLEKDKKRVGRVFNLNQLEQVNYIHNLCHVLFESGIPIQIPISKPIICGDRFITYYSYVDDCIEDFQDEWYAPEVTPNRLKNAARVFARFQQVALVLKGPEKPLDLPYCNTINWMYDHDPLNSLLGPWLFSEELNRPGSVLIEFKQTVSHLIENVVDNIKALKRGLCHADFHASNTIFAGDEIQQVVDFGFWINHPLKFDLAIALEMWSRNWNARDFELNKKFYVEFMEEYLNHNGPMALAEEDVYLLPLSRLWIETYGIRIQKDSSRVDIVTKYLSSALERINWYLDHIDKLL